MFHRSSFSPLSFSPQAFHGAVQEGRSGYWRLFYMRMQEEDLAKRGVAEEQKEPVVAEKKKRAIPKTRSVPDAEEPQVEIPPFVFKDVSLPYDTYNDTENLVNSIDNEHSLIFQWNQYKIYSQLVIVKEAENDDDDILLLLAA